MHIEKAEIDVFLLEYDMILFMRDPQGLQEAINRHKLAAFVYTKDR